MKMPLSALVLSGTLLFAQSPAKAPRPASPAVPPAKLAPTEKPGAKAAASPMAGPFLGNAHSKVVHRADCRLAAKLKPAHKVALASMAEAEKAGYKACKICKP